MLIGGNFCDNNICEAVLVFTRRTFNGSIRVTSICSRTANSGLPKGRNECIWVGNVQQKILIGLKSSKWNANKEKKYRFNTFEYNLKEDIWIPFEQTSKHRYERKGVLFCLINDNCMSLLYDESSIRAIVELFVIGYIIYVIGECIHSYPN